MPSQNERIGGLATGALLLGVVGLFVCARMRSWTPLCVFAGIGGFIGVIFPRATLIVGTVIGRTILSIISVG